MTDPVKPKKNLIMPTTPMFASIMNPVANKLVRKLCKVKNIQGHEGLYVDTVRELDWNNGPNNDNLEQCQIAVGTVGMVLGKAAPSTMLRFLVVSSDADDGAKVNKDAIYHLSVLNLEILDEKKANQG